MTTTDVYSARTVFDGLKKTFHQYLEAQYHVWDAGLIEERRRLLAVPGVTFQEPRLETTPSYVTGAPYGLLDIPSPARAVLSLAATRPHTGIYSEPYAHQASALEASLGRDEELIVATGTGSGKTESFLMPILGSLAIESSQRPESWKAPGMRALLLYPMNALVNDQVSRLRRLLGDERVAHLLRGDRNRNATFGMYTSRTPYAGHATASKDRSRIGALLEHLFRGISPESIALLKTEGKWPAKDLESFFASDFKTGPNDSELFSRQEMQKVSPDLLVTNYSMLEYMLLRQIEHSLFDQTANWLACDSANRLIVVLDEAHMYRGSGGAEVAYLLRRLHSRLRAGRERFRYILTSASLGSGAVAVERTSRFAADLTGQRDSSRKFVVISGVAVRKDGPRPASIVEAAALATFELASIHRVREAPGVTREALQALFLKLGQALPESALAEEDLRDAVQRWLSHFGPAAMASNRLTSAPESLQSLTAAVFPSLGGDGRAVESLLALMSFARDKQSGRVFAPVRSHMFFRGLPGLYACVNIECTRLASSGTRRILGSLHSAPRIRCDCGSRVFELLTHRDCGAAFIRGFLVDEQGDFLWHERSSGLWNDLNLIEAHLLVEPERQSQSKTSGLVGVRAWLHCSTGRIVAAPPASELRNQFLQVLRPEATIVERGRSVLTFDRECPVCLRSWQGQSKIMDLATKGEAPFAHLVREQVVLQPPTRARSDRSPNEGRKALLFSDGRQKAARLARDIPREIEQDVFRQLLLMAAQTLVASGREAVLSLRLYIAFIDVLSRTGLQLFDGQDREDLRQHVGHYRRWHESDLNDAIGEFSGVPPARFSAQLLRQLGSRFYSVYSLTLAFIAPTRRAALEIGGQLPFLGDEEVRSLSVVWAQGLANEFAFDPNLRLGVRQQAAGYPISAPQSRGFTKRQSHFLRERLGAQSEDIHVAFEGAVCSSDQAGSFFLNPGRVALELALKQDWYQCYACTSVSPVAWWGHCPNCLAPGALAVQPETTPYLRARKGFWRDPLARVLEGKAVPMNLTVEEHTAQLSYRDADDPSTTTEEFERRFRDILVRPDDVSVDVLSSTTTMEVGIDIGSLVAVGLRNIPPLRQNYQQRAGRTGRRGSAISTVLTYAQNSPHDNHYFQYPEKIISGEPTLPGVDTNNPRIIERHIRAQIVQTFFRSRGGALASYDLLSVFGATWTFFSEGGQYSLAGLSQWVESSPEAASCYADIQVWLPVGFAKSPAQVASEFLVSLESQRPLTEADLDQDDRNLIEFLFSRGHLPSYAFPRDLCALQIEGMPAREGRPRIPVIQRPQQGLNIALSEYAPGRLVVVDKKTYRIGTVAAGGASSVVNRADRLFSGRRRYVHCEACSFTAGFQHGGDEGTPCPVCETGRLSSVTVIQPEVVFPEGGQEVDEFDDEQVFSQATSAQLPLPEADQPFIWDQVYAKGAIATARNQSMVMVNKGQESVLGEDGFLVCMRCGKTALDGRPLGPHRRDYRIEAARGGARPSPLCGGEQQRVYLGYSFSSDVLLFRIPLEAPLRFDPVDKRGRRPVADALQSVCEALVLGVGQELDIDIREISAGYRFVRHGQAHFADIFVYDTLSGGAGYATLAGEVFGRVLDRAEALVRGCDCSSSCDKCLRHYGNRFHHAALDRGLAGEVIAYVKTGLAPEAFDLQRQRLELEPLEHLLELAGWSTSHSGDTPATVSVGGRSTRLWVVPSLIDPSAIGIGCHEDEAVFSPYELSRDLPGAFAEVS